MRCSLIYLFLFLAFSLEGVSQEVLMETGDNPVLINYFKNISGKKNLVPDVQVSPGDTLTLPIIDDVTSGNVFPYAGIWKDSLAFIHSDYPVNPPSIGVATLEGLGKNGSPYN